MCNFGSCFRNLKGGKISLVVLALLLGGLASSAHAVALGEHYFDSNTFLVINTGDTTYEEDDSTKPYTIHVDGVTTNFNLTNNATISAIHSAEFGYEITAIGAGEPGDPPNGLASLHITNNGSIIASSAGTDFAIAIAPTVLSGDDAIINSGDINATATGTGKAIGIGAYYLSDNARIENAGTISVETNATDDGLFGGMGVFGFGMENNASIVNSGTLEVTNTVGSAIGIAALVGVDGSTITNIGTIAVDGNLSSVGILSFSLAPNASITNSGTILATVNGAFDQSAFSVKSIINDGNITNNLGGELYGNISVRQGEDSTGIFINEGLISLPHNASGGAAAFIQNFNQTATGVLEIRLSTDGITTNHSQLKTKTAVFANGSTIKVNVLDASIDEQLLVGGRLNNVVTADTNLTIDGTLQIQDNSSLLDFEYVISDYDWVGNIWDGNGTAGAIHLNIVEGLSIVEASGLGGANTDTLGAATVLESIQDQLDDFFGALAGAGNEQIAQAVASTTPVSGVSTSGAVTQIMNGIQGIVEQRQGANFGVGLNSGEDVFSEKTFWFKPYGSWGKQDNKGGINGFDLSAKGVGMGFDGSYAKDSKAGIAFFYTDADVDINNMTQKSEFKAYTTLIYGIVPVLDERTKFLYQVGYSWQNVDISTDLQKGDYTSKTVSLDAKVMRDYKINDELTLQPLVEATYRDFRSPSYEQSGALITTLVDSFNAQELIVGVGALAHYKLDDVSKIVANVNLGYDLIDDSNSITSAYSVAPTVKFTTNGIDNGRWVYKAGIGYERLITKESVISLMYNYEAQGSSYDNHAVSARLQYKF